MHNYDEMADWFSIELDSRHDHQTGFIFSVNASGVISDEMVFHDEDYDSDWNAIWHAEVQIDDDGWMIEMEIPFSNLPFLEYIISLNFLACFVNFFIDEIPLKVL